MNFKNNLEAKKRLIRLISFFSTIIFASTAVMFATLMDSTLLLAIILLPCVITLSISIIPVPLSARNILICAIISVVVAIAAIVYVWLMNPEAIMHYLGD